MAFSVHSIHIPCLFLGYTHCLQFFLADISPFLESSVSWGLHYNSDFIITVSLISLGGAPGRDSDSITHFCLAYKQPLWHLSGRVCDLITLKFCMPKRLKSYESCQDLLPVWVESLLFLLWLQPSLMSGWTQGNISWGSPEWAGILEISSQREIFQKLWHIYTWHLEKLKFGHFLRCYEGIISITFIQSTCLLFNAKHFITHTYLGKNFTGIVFLRKL